MYCIVYCIKKVYQIHIFRIFCAAYFHKRLRLSLTIKDTQIKNYSTNSKCNRAPRNHIIVQNREGCGFKAEKYAAKPSKISRSHRSIFVSSNIFCTPKRIVWFWAQDPAAPCSCIFCGSVHIPSITVPGQPDIIV